VGAKARRRSEKSVKALYDLDAGSNDFGRWIKETLGKSAILLTIDSIEVGASRGTSDGNLAA
jgi:hypothetical protein